MSDELMLLDGPEIMSVIDLYDQVSNIVALANAKTNPIVIPGRRLRRR